MVPADICYFLCCLCEESVAHIKQEDNFSNFYRKKGDLILYYCCKIDILYAKVSDHEQGGNSFCYINISKKVQSYFHGV